MAKKVTDLVRDRLGETLMRTKKEAEQNVCPKGHGMPQNHVYCYACACRYYTVGVDPVEQLSR